METQKDLTGEAAGKKRGEGPSEVPPLTEETTVPGEAPRQPTTDEALLKEAEAAGQETSSGIDPTPGDPEVNEEEDYYCPGCGRTGGCTCGNPEPYRGHPWVFDEPAGLSYPYGYGR